MKKLSGYGFLAALFIAAGTLHFLFPAPYLRVMPPQLPYPLELVYLSGAAEILGGAGLLFPRTRRASAIGLICLLLAVWPANFQMLLNARAIDVMWWQELLLWLRLPLQPVLIWWIWRATK